jgi:hypothetical protein
MKKSLILSVFIAIGFIICSCSNKNNNTTTLTTNSNSPDTESYNGPANGTYDASGKITFTIDGTDYSCAISKVIAAPSSVTFQTETADIRNTGSIVVTCYTAATAITPGTYTAASAETISSVTFIDKKVIPYSATAATAGSSCTVTISSLTSTSIQGTFNATVIKPIDKTTLSIANGVINCTITGKSEG